MRNQKKMIEELPSQSVVGILAGSPAQQSKWTTVLERLQQSIFAHSSWVNDLEERLTPVLGPEFSTSEEASDPGEPASPMVDVLLDLNAQVTQVNERLKYILSRLEI